MNEQSGSRREQQQREKGDSCQHTMWLRRRMNQQSAASFAQFSRAATLAIPLLAKAEGQIAVLDHVHDLALHCDKEEHKPVCVDGLEGGPSKRSWPLPRPLPPGTLFPPLLSLHCPTLVPAHQYSSRMGQKTGTSNTAKKVAPKPSRKARPLCIQNLNSGSLCVVMFFGGRG